MRVFIFLFLAAMGPVFVQAQGNYMISYPISFPMGNLHSYSSNVSFRGINFEFNKKTSPQTTAGLEVGWNVFYRHADRQVYQEGTASITGVQYRYTNAVPIIAGGKYYAHTGSAIRPYVGLGLGTVYVHRTTDFGIYEALSDAWQFCIRPEAGLDMRMGRGTSFFIGAKYYWAFNEGELDGQPYLSVNIGLKMAAF